MKLYEDCLGRREGSADKQQATMAPPPTRRTDSTVRVCCSTAISSSDYYNRVVSIQASKTGNSATYVTPTASTVKHSPPATPSWIDADDDLEIISVSSVNYAVGPSCNPLTFVIMPGYHVLEPQQEWNCPLQDLPFVRRSGEQQLRRAPGTRVR
jgi:hypothetical protein